MSLPCRRVLVFLTTVGFLAASQGALAQGGAPRARPPVKGRTHNVRLDSSPQQAAVYWDKGGAGSAPRDFGIAGYTPLTLKLPKGPVKLVIELRGFKTIEKELSVAKSQTMTFTMERAGAPGKLDLRASGSAAGAEVLIDGVPRGSLPNTFEVSPGRHQLEVKKPGFKTYADWIEIGEEERRTRDIVLESSAGGSLLVVADGGGDVYLDGEKKDVAPAMIANVPPGEHVVEVRKEGMAPWRQTVTIAAGQQTKVSASMAPPKDSTTAASLRIISPIADVQVYVDGEDKGRAPQDVGGLRPGQHIVEGRKKGFKTREETVKLTPGEHLLVQLKLDPAPDEQWHGILKVQSAVPDAEVFLDGASLGKAPIERTNLEPGKHYVTVRKDGYAEFKREVQLVENRSVVVAAELKAVGSMKFFSSPEGAQVFIDGEPVPGKTPNNKEEVSSGEHVIEMKLPAYFDFKQVVKVEGGREKLVQADLQKIPTGPTPEQIARRKKGMSSFGAKVVPPKSFTADLGLGFPYLFTGRLTVGIMDRKPLYLDGGVEFRTYFQSNELAAHSRLQFVDAGPFSVAIFADIGGGFGPNGRNTFFFDFGPVASLSFNEMVTFSTDLRFSYWNDQLCPTPGDIGRGVQPRKACKDFATNGLWEGEDPSKNRYDGKRLYIDIALEVAINRQLSAFGIFQFVPVFGESFLASQYLGRKAFIDAYNDTQLKNDPLVYGTLGLTLKF